MKGAKISKGETVQKGVPITKGVPVKKGEKVSREELMEEFLSRRDALLRDGAEFRVERTIGEHVIELVRTGKAVTLENVVASLEKSSDRLVAEPAIRRLSEAAGCGSG
jgi:hypothetical protein